MKRFLPFVPRRLLPALVLSVVVLPTTFARDVFSKIVVFGDSLSDRGNMVEFTHGAFPAPPQYAYGRQSNGPVWIEYLAWNLWLGRRIENYAVAGALTKPAPGFPTGNVWSDTYPGLEGTDLASQVADYLLDANGVADPQALYVISGGSNDFPRVADPAVIVTNLIELMVTLQSKGAGHILLVNLPDLGKTPRVILGERAGQLPAGTAAMVSAACAQLNEALATAVPLYTAPGVKVTIGDAYAFLARTTSHPRRYGLRNVDEPYLLNGSGTNPWRWLFWDDLHPTTRGHQIFADQVMDSLKSTYRKGRGHHAHSWRGHFAPAVGRP